MISPRRGTIWLAGTPVQVTPTEFRLLAVLPSQPETVVSRAVLAEQVWGHYDETCDHVIDVHLGRLRVKLRSICPDAGSVVTVRGRGVLLATSRA